MKKKIYLLIVVVLLSAQVGCTQQLIKKSYAFSKPISIGNPSADADHTNTMEYYAFFSAKQAVKFGINHVWVGGHLYTPSLTKMKDAPVEVGYDNNRKPIMVKSEVGYNLYYLQLDRSEVQKKVPVKYKLKTGTMLIEVKSNGKVYYYSLPVKPLAADVSTS